MVNMHEIIVKITGQDGLSPILARNAQGLNHINKNAGLTGSVLKHSFEDNGVTMLQARASIDKYNAGLEAAKKQITGGLTPAMKGINTYELEQLGIQMSATSKKTFNLKGHVTNLSKSLQGMGGIVSGLIGIGLGAWLKSTVDTAIHSQHEWGKLNAVLKEHGGNIQTAKKEITDIASRYGFARGEVREASRVFMQAGMSYQEVTKNQGALTAAMALSVGTGRSVDESAKLLQKAYMGQGRALKELGLDIKKYKNESTGVVDVNRLNQDILEKTAKQLEAHGESGEAAIMRYNNSMEKLQTTIGEKLLPVLTPVLTTITDLINKFVEAPSYVQYFTAGLIALAAGSMILAPLISSLGVVWGSLKKIGRFFKKKHKMDMDCGVCTPDLPFSSSGKKANKGKGKSGKKGRLGRVASRIPGVGRVSGLLGNMGNLGRLGSLGGLGRLGGLAAGAARFAGPLGLAVTAATAGYGAYQGWNETKGPVQEKAKGAVGGAVEQLSFGLINKQQTMDGINWLYNQTKEIPGKIESYLGQLKDKVSKPFVDAWGKAQTITTVKINQVKNYIKSLPQRAREALRGLLGAISSHFINAWNKANQTVKSGIDKVLGAFSGLPGQIEEWMKSAADTVKYWADKIGGPLLEIYCRIMGCSPGIIPAFRKLGEAIPHHIDKTLPHLEKLNNAMNIPNTNFKISTIPTLDTNTLQSINIPLNTPKSGYVSKNSMVTNSRTISNDHTHYHEPITINAKDMSRHELQSSLISILEEGNRRYIPP